MENYSTTDRLLKKEHLFSDEEEIAISIYYIFNLSMALLGNITLLLVIIKRRKLHEPTYYLVANLAASDLIFALILGPINAASGLLESWIYGDVFCKIYSYVTYTLAMQSLITMAFISIDRYCAICKPLHYHSLITKKKCLIFVIYSWIHALLVTSPPLYGWNEYTYFPHLALCQLNWAADPYFPLLWLGFTTFAPSTGIIIFCNMAVYREAQKMKDLPGTKSAQGIDKIKAEVKKMRMLIAVLLVFAITYVIYIIVRLTIGFYGYNDLLKRLEYISMLTYTIANFINPFIYGVMNREFRSQVKYVFKSH